VKARLAALAILGLIVSAPPVAAHHGTGISYDLVHPPITLKGTVTEFRWKNPHVSVFMDVKDANGKVVNWGLEGNSIVNHARDGWSSTTLKAGDEVTALVYPSKVPNTPAAVIAHITLANGKNVLNFQRDTPGGRPVE
jgi:hypothetical protein